jgi:hypothetical protein
MSKNWYVNGVKAVGRQTTFTGDMEEILACHNIILEEVLLLFFFFAEH